MNDSEQHGHWRIVMDRGIPIGTIRGVPVTAHWTVIVILWLFTWSLAELLPHTAPGHSQGIYLLAGAIGAGMLLVSLLMHEMTHAEVARRAGIEVAGVRLWLFGGIAQLRSEPRTPRVAFRVAVSGPVTSLLLAALFACAATALHGAGATGVVVAVAWWLAAINLMLAVFNLLPAAPLDGGQVLRAFLWHRTGDKVRATLSAARTGRFFAVFLVGIGLLQLAAGAVVGGIWLMLIGSFLYAAARDETTSAAIRYALTGVVVSDVMTADPDVAPDWIFVQDFIDQYVLGQRHSAYPVKNEDGTITGLVSLAQLRRVAPHNRAATLIRDIATPREQVPSVTPTDSVIALLDRLSPTGDKRALVVDDGDRIVGIVTLSDLTRLIDVVRLMLPSAPASATREDETQVGR